MPKSFPSEHGEDNEGSRRPSYAVRLLKSALRIAVGVLVGGTLTLVLFEKQLIYHPAPDLALTPAALDLPFEEVFLESEPGVRVHAWFIKARGERPSATVLLSHGNAGNMADRLDRVRSLRELNVDFLLYDYRGFGRSTGALGEEGTYQDGRAAYDYLIRVRGVDPRRLILMGESLGCAISIQLAIERPAAGLALEAPFASIPHMAAAIYPFLPLEPFIRTRYDNLAKIPRLMMPLFVVQGTDDPVIPIEQGRMVFEAAPEPKRFLAVPGAHHNDVYVVGGRTYRQALAEFIRGAITDIPSPLTEESKP